MGCILHATDSCLHSKSGILFLTESQWRRLKPPAIFIGFVYIHITNGGSIKVIILVQFMCIREGRRRLQLTDDWQFHVTHRMPIIVLLLYGFSCNFQQGLLACTSWSNVIIDSVLRFHIRVHSVIILDYSACYWGHIGGSNLLITRSTERNPSLVLGRQ